MKKFLCLMTCLILCTTFSTNVRAAQGISSDEQRILDALEAGVTIAGKQVAFPSIYTKQVTQFLEQEEISREQADAIVDEIEDIKEILQENHINDFKRINSGVASQIFHHAKEAVNEVNVSLTLKGDKIVAYQGDQVIFSCVDQVKDTPANYKMLLLVTGIIAIALIGISYMIGHSERVAKKRT